MNWIDELIRVLDKDETRLRRVAPGELALDAIESVTLDPPARVFLSDLEFERHLTSLSKTLPAWLKGDDEPLEAALKLFVLFFEGEVSEYGSCVAEVRLTDGRLVAKPSKAWRPDPRSDYDEYDNDYDDDDDDDDLYAEPLDCASNVPGAPWAYPDRPPGLSWLTYWMRDLASVGTALLPLDLPGRLSLTTYFGEPLDPPVRVLIKPDDLEEHMDWLADAADDTDEHPLQIAYRQFQLNFVEEMHRYERVAKLELCDGRLRASPAK